MANVRLPLLTFGVASLLALSACTSAQDVSAAIHEIQQLDTIDERAESECDNLGTPPTFELIAAQDTDVEGLKELVESDKWSDMALPESSGKFVAVCVFGGEFPEELSRYDRVVMYQIGGNGGSGFISVWNVD